MFKKIHNEFYKTKGGGVKGRLKLYKKQEIWYRTASLKYTNQICAMSMLGVLPNEHAHAEASNAQNGSGTYVGLPLQR